MMRKFKPGATVRAAVTIVYVEIAREVAEGARGHVSTRTTAGLPLPAGGAYVGYAPIVWDAFPDDVRATSTDSLDFGHRPHRWTIEEARAAGQKGGAATQKKRAALENPPLGEREASGHVRMVALQASGSQEVVSDALALAARLLRGDAS